MVICYSRVLIGIFYAWETIKFKQEISGGSRGGVRGPAPLFVDQTATQRAEKNVFETWVPPLSQGLDERHPPPPPPLSEGLDPPLERANATLTVACDNITHANQQ